MGCKKFKKCIKSTTDLIRTLKNAKLPLSFVSNASTYSHLTTPEALAQLKYSFGVQDHQVINYADMVNNITGVNRVENADSRKNEFKYNLQWYKNFDISFVNVMAALMAMDYSQGKVPNFE